MSVLAKILSVLATCMWLFREYNLISVLLSVQAWVISITQPYVAQLTQLLKEQFQTTNQTNVKP
jgi:hypothetical protein